MHRSGSDAFFGIPYAKAPVGPLLYAAPQPPVPWEGVRDATKPGATALYQTMPNTLIPEPAVAGDDYLTVNVFTPTTTPDAPLPVLFWIHGGGFLMGSPTGPWYQGESFKRDDVIVVTCGYRLGFAGFGWLPGGDNNRAVRDWLAALEWVQENIGAFGGDPDQVTIAGQSAGGTAVLTLLSMPSAQHLFKSVWASSAVLIDLDPGQAMEFTYRLAHELGIPATEEEFQCVDAERMFQAETAASEPEEKGPAGLRSRLDDGLPLAPVVDGDLIPDSVLGSIKKGVGADKPLVIGSNKDELITLSQTIRGPLKLIPPKTVARILGIKGKQLARYAADNPQSFRKGSPPVAVRIATDRVFRVEVVRVAGARASRPESVEHTWVYTFDWASPVYGGAVHCVDVPFFFDVLARNDTEALLGSNAPRDIAKELHQDAVELVKRGLVDWPYWSPAARIVKVFDDVPQSPRFGTYGGSHLRKSGYDAVDALV